MFDDLHVLRERARVAAARGDLDGASMALWAAAGQTHADEHEYLLVLRQLEEVLTRRGDVRGALTVVAYVGSDDPGAWVRAYPLLPHVPAVDRALVAAAQGHLAEAARELEGDGRIAAAAIHRERAGEWAAACALWSRLVHAGASGDTYVEALVRFNLARCARRCDDAAGAREATVACVRLLEEAADHFESSGQRERAFDCFQVLVQVGREAGAFEDVLEGSVNCIRILREDHLRQFALDYFEASIAAALERDEMSAAATFAREAAEYARSLGLGGAAAAFAVRQAELWRAAANQHAQRGDHADVVAHALLAAILAFASVGQYARVGQLYREIAMLDLDPARREHYTRASSRYAHVVDEPLETVQRPRRARSETGQSDVWHIDVLEWEQRGSAVEVCAEVMLDRRGLELIRRKAMLTRLAALRVEDNPHDTSPSAVQARARLADQLAQLQHYAVLSPLEALFASADWRVKVAVLEALQTLFYKRTFVTLRAALRDPDARVVQRAAKTLEALHFEHAFDPLARIFRESASPLARASSLRAIARIDTRESAELLLGVLEHGAPSDRGAALAAVQAASPGQFLELARSVLSSAPEPLRSSLREFLVAHGSLAAEPGARDASR
jgi:hypothetical protein